MSGCPRANLVINVLIIKAMFLKVKLQRGVHVDNMSCGSWQVSCHKTSGCHNLSALAWTRAGYLRSEGTSLHCTVGACLSAVSWHNPDTHTQGTSIWQAKNFLPRIQYLSLGLLRCPFPWDPHPNSQVTYYRCIVFIVNILLLSFDFCHDRSHQQRQHVRWVKTVNIEYARVFLYIQ